MEIYVRKGIEISCCSVLQYLTAECLIQNTALKCISVVVRHQECVAGRGAAWQAAHQPNEGQQGLKAAAAARLPSYRMS